MGPHDLFNSTVWRCILLGSLGPRQTQIVQSWSSYMQKVKNSWLLKSLSTRLYLHPFSSISWRRCGLMRDLQEPSPLGVEMPPTFWSCSTLEFSWWAFRPFSCIALSRGLLGWKVQSSLNSENFRRNWGEVNCTVPFQFRIIINCGNNVLLTFPYSNNRYSRKLSRHKSSSRSYSSLLTILYWKLKFFCNFWILSFRSFYWVTLSLGLLGWKVHLNSGNFRCHWSEFNWAMTFQLTIIVNSVHNFFYISRIPIIDIINFNSGMNPHQDDIKVYKGHFTFGIFHWYKNKYSKSCAKLDKQCNLTYFDKIPSSRVGKKTPRIPLTINLRLCSYSKVFSYHVLYGNEIAGNLIFPCSAFQTCHIDSKRLFYLIYADMTGRGSKKFGDECREDRECGFAGSVCDSKNRKCFCREEFTATNHIDKCGHRELNPWKINKST